MASSGRTLTASTTTLSTPTTRKYLIEKLNESNYRMWKLKMELILQRMDLLTTIRSEIGQPTTEPEATEWKMKDLDARTEIIMHLTDRQFDLVKHLESSKEMWDLLK